MLAKVVSGRWRGERDLVGCFDCVQRAEDRPEGVDSDSDSGPILKPCNGREPPTRRPASEQLCWMGLWGCMALEVDEEERWNSDGW